ETDEGTPKVYHATTGTDSSRGFSCGGRYRSRHSTGWEHSSRAARLPIRRTPKERCHETENPDRSFVSRAVGWAGRGPRAERGSGAIHTRAADYGRAGRSPAYRRATPTSMP